ncbi:invertebrate-type lysozyme 2-like isoform X2 [Macrobrachium rosenbergii]|uniref:invertebrate-type lysozyme 2-like isoform X2 n=1 Tax=Macrobrachium rosenbergii TaxID=79674 RepID=UPI0034D3F4CA
MSLIKTAIVCVTAAVIFALVQGQGSVQPNCLGCICEASTQCNVSVGCHTPYAGAYFCGPFLISWAYWADAGKPVIQNDDPNRQGAFENCVNDLYCSAETVRQYMGKFATDCTGDGAINCEDIVRVHKIGYNGCNANVNANDAFWQSFRTCSARVNVD